MFVNIGLSLDGYVAPDGMTLENPGYKNWGAKWGVHVRWLLNQQYMRAPVLFGCGRRLFENPGEPAPKYRIENGIPGPAATHFRYVRQRDRAPGASGRAQAVRHIYPAQAGSPATFATGLMSWLGK